MATQHFSQANRVPVAGDSSQQPFVINLDAIEAGLSAPPSGNNNGTMPPQNGSRNAGVGAAWPYLRSLIKPAETSLPFIVIVLVKVLYDHRLGILVFLAMIGTSFHANSSLRRFIAQYEVHKSNETLVSFVWLISFLTVNIACVYYVFDEQKLYRSLYLVFPEVQNITLWSLLWITLTADFVIMFSTMILKALIALIPYFVLPFKKKGKLYMVTEVLSQTYRSIVPITPWIHFLLDDEHTGRWFSIVLVIVYVACKQTCAALVSKWRTFAIKQLFGIQNHCGVVDSNLDWQRIVESFGKVPSWSQLESCGNTCAICHENFTDPVALSCTHVFCENCITTWFNRERTCPMCRTNIVSTPQWRDGSTSCIFHLY